MKLLSFEVDGRESFGCLDYHAICDLGAVLGGRFGGLRQVIAADAVEACRKAMEAAPRLGLCDIRFLPPIPDPDKILCIGVNYRDRNEEYKDGSEPPKYPSLFMRTRGSLVGHREPLVRPRESEKFDYEGEIVLVIGKAGRRIPEPQADSHIFGLTLMNDGSVRDWLRHGKFNVTQGKNFERSGSMGPWVATADECPPFTDLKLETRVNGEVRQQGWTSDLLFSFARILSYISTFAELKPGDLIATGTPTGAGGRFDPPKWLKLGDVVEIESPAIGTLSNSVIDEQD